MSSGKKIVCFSIIKGVYLKELEPKFREMRDVLHIVPTDKVNSARFWKKVREAMPGEQLELPRILRSRAALGAAGLLAGGSWRNRGGRIRSWRG